MNREEAARILDPSTSDIEFEKDISHWSERFDVAKAMGAEALRSRWVKTSDRLPMQSCDTAGCGKVFVLIKKYYEPGYIVRIEWVDYIADHPEEFNYWMPIPPFPVGSLSQRSGTDKEKRN